MPQPDNLDQAEKSGPDLAAAAAQGETIQQWAAQYPTAQAQAAAAGTNKWPVAGQPTGDTVPNEQLHKLWDAANKKNAQDAANAKARSELPGDIEQALAPYTGMLGALPGDYQNAISSIMNDPNSKLPSNVEMPSNLPPGVQGSEKGLTNAINAATSATLQGTTGVANALKAMPGSIATMAQDLPYADVISTMLQQKKNELLYGSTTPLAYKPNTADWSSGLQAVAQWIEGGGGAGPKNLSASAFESAITSGTSGSAPGQSGGSGIGGY